jgi:hypothetical protein
MNSVASWTADLGVAARRFTRNYSAVWIAALSALATGCEPTAPQSSLEVVRPEWVAGSAAERLDANGHFAIDHSVEAGSAVQIGYERAISQATAWLTNFGPLRADGLSEDRGEPIVVGELSLCDRTYYASRTYLELSDTNPRFARRPFGPYWMVSFCGRDGRSAIILAVSAYNDDVSITDGAIHFGTGITGGEFSSYAVPHRFDRFVISPETAVRLAFEATGRRVVSVPTLHMPPRPIQQIFAKWRVELESPVTVKLTDGREMTTPEIWIGSGNGPAEADMFAAVDALPLQYLSYPTLDSSGHDGPVVSVVFSPRPERSEWVRIDKVQDPR